MSVSGIPLAKQSRSKSGHILLIAGILVIAINLRPALATVGPLISQIREATGLSNSMLGLLTTLPLLAFGMMSSLTPLVTRKFGIGYTLLGAVLIIAIGIVIRSMDGVVFLFSGTILFGIGIAFGNVLLPSLTKEYFTTNSGIMTSLYSAVMAIGASLAAGISVPLSKNFGLGWRGTLGIWIVFAVLAFFVWLPLVSRFKKTVQSGTYLKSMLALGKKMLAWKIALFMGLQSMAFYIILAWLPEILQSRGFDAHFSGWMLSLSQATGIAGSVIIPLWASKKKNQKKIVFILFLMEIAGITGLLFSHGNMVILWVSFIGFVLGGCFGLALLFIVLRSKDTATTTELSGMAQSIGYLVAATGPILFGKVFDLTLNWSYPLLLLLVIATAKLYAGLGAGSESKL
jgi:CP family cyanate transporter-like MFS transporter